jgi:hypothetical protein
VLEYLWFSVKVISMEMEPLLLCMQEACLALILSAKYACIIERGWFQYNAFYLICKIRACLRIIQTFGVHLLKKFCQMILCPNAHHVLQQYNSKLFEDGPNGVSMYCICILYSATKSNSRQSICRTQSLF